MNAWTFPAAVVVCALVCGCAARPAPRAATSPPAATTLPTSQPSYTIELNAHVLPPAGWQLEIKPPGRRNVRHFVWVSPSGRTAYGVMRFSLPVPLPHEPVLWVFLSEMRKSQGQATLLSKIWDGELPGLRFEAEGGMYHLRTNFRIRGLTGWMTYAGTLRDAPVDAQELREAEAAREQTRFGDAP